MTARREAPARAGDLCGVDLYWLPLGAGEGGRCVRSSGRLYETIAAMRRGRPRSDLYHSALVVHLDGSSFAIEMTPVWAVADPDRGVVGEGSVGLAILGRSRLFRYEVRCWRDGTIPDLAAAVDSPRRVSNDRATARRLLELAPSFPRATWGRDEQGTGEMWNSNSLVAWVLARTGCDMRVIGPPRGGRAPGWDAGLVLAARPALNGLPSGSPSGSRRAAGRARSGRSTRR